MCETNFLQQTVSRGWMDCNKTWSSSVSMFRRCGSVSEELCDLGHTLALTGWYMWRYYSSSVTVIVWTVLVIINTCQHKNLFSSQQFYSALLASKAMAPNLTPFMKFSLIELQSGNIYLWTVWCLSSFKASCLILASV